MMIWPNMIGQWSCSVENKPVKSHPFYLLNIIRIIKRKKHIFQSKAILPAGTINKALHPSKPDGRRTMSHMDNLALMIFVLVVVVIPTVVTLQRYCYDVSGRSFPAICDVNNCFYAKCSNGINYVSGCAHDTLYNETMHKVETQCRVWDTHYQPGSIRFCNCDQCNSKLTKFFKCETSGPTPAPGEDTIPPSTTTTTTTTTTPTTPTMKTKIPGRRTQWTFATRKWKMGGFLDKVTPFPPGARIVFGDD